MKTVYIVICRSLKQESLDEIEEIIKKEFKDYEKFGASWIISGDCTEARIRNTLKEKTTKNQKIIITRMNNQFSTVGVGKKLKSWIKKKLNKNSLDAKKFIDEYFKKHLKDMIELIKKYNC